MLVIVDLAQAGYMGMKDAQQMACVMNVLLESDSTYGYHLDVLAWGYSHHF